jgi:hypothetical protein
MNEELDIRFNGDDGDVAGDALGIGFPLSAIELAEAVEELSVFEPALEDVVLGDERLRPRLRQQAAALGMAAVVGVLVGVAVARAA